MKGLIFYIVCLFFVFSTFQNAQADPVINNTGIPSPSLTITFSELSFSTGTPITDQFASYGVTFSPSYYYNVQPIFFPTDFLANFVDETTNNPISLNFTQDQTAVAFAMQTNTGLSTFEALLNGSVVETFSATTTLSPLPDLTHASDFFGFSNLLFDEIRITAPGIGAMQIDNLQLQPVPVPGAILLGSIGFGFAGWLLKRKNMYNK